MCARPRKHTAALGVLAALIAGLAACTNPLSPQLSSGPKTDAAGEGTGAMVVSVAPSGVRPATLLPDFQLSAVETYRVSLSDGPPGAAVPGSREVAAEDSGAFPGEVVFEDLVPGDWTVTVEGLDDTGIVVLRGEAPDQNVPLGARLNVNVTLGLLETGSGSYELTVTWPTDQNVKAIQYRFDGGGWNVIASDSFADLGGGLSGVTIAGDLAAGSYWITVRLDMGELFDQRYRAYVDERLYVYANLQTSETIPLTASDISDPPPEPGSWEELEEDGAIEIGEDGGISYNPDGYDYASGGNNIDVDPDTGSITYSGSGERRLFMQMPSVTAARLELTGVDMDQGNGWGVCFHGSENASGQFSGYTLQFDPGLGDQIVVRQWINNTEYTPFFAVDAADVGVDLYAPMDVNVHVNGPELRVDVDGTEIINISDLVSMANFPSSAPTEGFLGLRGWSNTDLTVEDLTLYVLD
jgi:hypothetical protein